MKKLSFAGPIINNSSVSFVFLLANYRSFIKIKPPLRQGSTKRREEDEEGAGEREETIYCYREREMKKGDFEQGEIQVDTIKRNYT